MEFTFHGLDLETVCRRCLISFGAMSLRVARRSGGGIASISFVQSLRNTPKSALILYCKNQLPSKNADASEEEMPRMLTYRERRRERSRCPMSACSRSRSRKRFAW